MWKWRIDCFTQVTQLFSSPERVVSFQPSGSGNDVWLEKMSDTGTCSARAVKKADSKWSSSHDGSVSGGREPSNGYSFIYSVYCQYWADFIVSLGQTLKHCVVNCILWKINLLQFYFSHLSSSVEKQICSWSTFRIIIPVNLVKICF